MNERDIKTNNNKRLLKVMTSFIWLKAGPHCAKKQVRLEVTSNILDSQAGELYADYLQIFNSLLFEYPLLYVKMKNT